MKTLLLLIHLISLIFGFTVLQERIYFNKDCREPYTEALLMKKDTCVYIGPNKSTKVSTNSTHINQYLCDSPDCSNCRFFQVRMIFNQCLQGEHFSSIIKSDRYVPDGKHIYGKIYYPDEMCRKNPEVLVSSILMNNCINSVPKNTIPNIQNYDFLERISDPKIYKSVKLHYKKSNNKEVEIKLYHESDCKGKITNFVIKTNTCHSMNKISIKLSPKPFE
jgi:hypothetical protein